MSQELGYQSYVDQPRVPGRFIAAGIGLLLIGLFSGCGAAMAPVTFRLASVGGVPRSILVMSIVSSLTVLLPIAVLNIWTGIACFQGKRWIRPIILIFSSFAGALGLPGLLAVMAASVNAPPVTPTPFSFAWIRVIGIVTVFIIYIVLPLVYFLLFRSAATRDLLSRLDPRTRWTDRLPVPLLGMSIVTMLLGLQLPLGPPVLQRGLLMGAEVNWLVAEAVFATIALVMIFAAILLFRQRAAGWWLAVGITALTAVSNYLNMCSFGPAIYQSALGNVRPAARPMNVNPNMMFVTQTIWLVTLMVAALWVKRCCLRRPVELPAGESSPPA